MALAYNNVSGFGNGWSDTVAYLDEYNSLITPPVVNSNIVYGTGVDTREAFKTDTF